MNTLSAHLALLGPICVLDGGNGLDAHAIARLARQGHACSASHRIRALRVGGGALGVSAGVASQYSISKHGKDANLRCEAQDNRVVPDQ